MMIIDFMKKIAGWIADNPEKMASAAILIIFAAVFFILIVSVAVQR